MSKKVQKVNFANLNVKPFIGADNNYEAAMFCDKFARAFAKMLHIKNIKEQVLHQQSQTLFGRNVQDISSTHYLLSFDYGDKKSVGHLLFDAPLSNYLVQKLLGGTENVITPLQDKELSRMDKTTLASLWGPLQLCLREALTPTLLLNDCQVYEDKSLTDFSLPEHISFFHEHFHVGETNLGSLHVFLNCAYFTRGS